MCREGGKWTGWGVSTSPEKGVWGLEQVLDVTQGGGMREMGVSFPAAWEGVLGLLQQGGDLMLKAGGRAGNLIKYFVCFPVFQCSSTGNVPTASWTGSGGQIHYLKR